MLQHRFAGSCRRLATALLISAALHALPASVRADSALDPRAMELLRAMSSTLAGASQLSARSVALFDAVQPGGIALKVGQEVLVQVKRPNKLHARVLRDDGTRRQLWFDGKTATIYDAKANSYSVIDAPGDVDDMFRKLSDDYAVDVPLSDLLVSNPYAAFEKFLISAAYVGTRMVDGVETHHLSLESWGADFQLWITADERALPLRFVITHATEPGEPGFLATLRDWEFESYVDDGIFIFHPPVDAKKVPFRKPEQ